MITTKEVADRFMELAGQGKNIEIQEELFGDNVECIEPSHADFPGAKGKEAVLARLKQWYSGVEEVHETSLTEPVVAGNFFALGMMMDITYKGVGRNKMDELCVYEVQDGKIVKEEYFY